MNSASKYAVAYAAQLRAIASTPTVQADPAIKANIEELEHFVTGYGNLTNQVCVGFASLSTAEPAWDSATYPVMLAGGRMMVKAATELSARLKALEVAALPPRSQAWETVKGNMADAALGTASATFKAARTTVATAVVVGAKSIFGKKNPLSVLRDRIGQDRIDNMVARVTNPLDTLQNAAAVVLPRVKKGLDLGADLGNDLADLFAEVIANDVDYVVPQRAEQKRLEATFSEATTLKEMADSIELSARHLCELGKAAVNNASANAITAYLAGNGTKSPVQRALAEIAATEKDPHGLNQKMNDAFGNLVRMGGNLFKTPAPEETDGVIPPAGETTKPTPAPSEEKPSSGQPVTDEDKTGKSGEGTAAPAKPRTRKPAGTSTRKTKGKDPAGQ
jgi:hypothetical protein